MFETALVSSACPELCLSNGTPLCMMLLLRFTEIILKMEWLHLLDSLPIITLIFCSSDLSLDVFSNSNLNFLSVWSSGSPTLLMRRKQVWSVQLLPGLTLAWAYPDIWGLPIWWATYGSFVNFASELLVDMLCCSYLRLSMCDFDTVNSWLLPGSIPGASLNCHGDPGQGYEESPWRGSQRRTTHWGQFFFATGMSPTLIMSRRHLMFAKLSATHLASPRMLAKNSELFWTAAEWHSQMQLGQTVATVMDKFVHCLIVKQVEQMPRHQWAFWPKHMMLYTAK
jgi:hypothetical protein